MKTTSTPSPPPPPPPPPPTLLLCSISTYWSSVVVKCTRRLHVVLLQTQVTKKTQVTFSEDITSTSFSCFFLGRAALAERFRAWLTSWRPSVAGSSLHLLVFPFPNDCDLWTPSFHSLRPPRTLIFVSFGLISPRCEQTLKKIYIYWLIDCHTETAKLFTATLYLPFNEKYILLGTVPVMQDISPGYLPNP